MLLTLQNGLGNEEFLAENFGAERVLGGFCFVCLEPRLARRDRALRRRPPCPRRIRRLSRRPRTHDIAWEFKRCGVVCSVAENLGLERWRKLVWNIPFNGSRSSPAASTPRRSSADDALRATDARVDG